MYPLASSFFEKTDIKFMYDDFFKENNSKLFDILGYEIKDWSNFYNIHC